MVAESLIEKGGNMSLTPSRVKYYREVVGALGSTNAFRATSLTVLTVSSGMSSVQYW